MKITVKDKYSISKREFTDEGFLVVTDNKLARSGILEYLPEELGLPKQQGLVKIYRDPDDLFSQEVIDSFKSKTVTLQHPQKFISSKNLSGVVGFSKDDIRRDGDYMVGSVVITDQEGIDAIESGTAEISLGYEADVIPQKGVYMDQEYTHVFKGISGNHIAIVDRGRNGSMCKISDKKTKKGKIMAKISDGGIEFEVEDQIKQVFDKISGERDALKTRVSDMEKEKEDDEEKIKDAEKKAEDAEKEKEEMKDSWIAPEKIEALVEERTSVIDKASSIVDSFDASGKSVMAIKKEVVSAKGHKIEDKSDDYVSACFDMLECGNTVKSTLQDHAGKALEIEDNRPESEKARERAMERNKNAYKGE